MWTKDEKRCYAGLLHHRHGGKNPGYAPSCDQITLFPGRMADACRYSDLRNRRRSTKPWLGGSSRLVFVSDMSDSLCDDVSFEYRATEIIENVISEAGLRHCWLWLTKRPKRMAEFSEWLTKHDTPWPDNLWAGTSVTEQKRPKRMDHLLKVGGKTTTSFLSLEPQWDAIDLTPWLSRLDWVVQGGESGANGKSFDLAWARGMRDQCRKAKVPYFLKQLGAKPCDDGKPLQQPKTRDLHLSDWTQWPAELRVRELRTVELLSDTVLTHRAKVLGDKKASKDLAP